MLQDFVLVKFCSMQIRGHNSNADSSSAHREECAMREFNVSQYISHLVHNVHARHIAEDLATRDNHILSDIGVYRGEVEQAAHVDLSHDAMEELQVARAHHDDKPKS
jgi:uncharacterized protein YjiS (DUF1127 family)